VLAAGYLAIAQAGSRRLGHDFDALDGRDRDHLAAADAPSTLAEPTDTKP
jgi:hypothetical protein